MLLSQLVAATQAVAATRSRLTKVDVLAELLTRLDDEEIVPAVGLLLAKPRQGRLGVGWRSLAGRAGAAPEPSDDVPPVPAAPLTVDDVDAAFSHLAAIAGPGSAAERASELDELAGRASAQEWDFLARVVIGELRTGALEGVLLDAVVRASGREPGAVRRAAMLSGDLAETARIALRGTAEDLDAVTLRVGRPVSPMLASTANSVAEAVELTGEASVEYKLDGARIQVHRDGDDVRIFTRSLAEVTHRLPEIVEATRALPVRSAIFDGETLSLDESGDPRPFQETMSRFGADAARAVALRPWFFDVLHLDGRDLVDEPLRVRRDELERVAPEYRMPGIVTDDPAAADELSRDALAAGHEGVVVKGIDSLYTAGRRGKAWVKVKPVLTYDLVVIGAEWGSGRRSGWLSNIHLGARDEAGEYGEPGGFVMVGKTFKGLTDELLRWQTETFPALETSRTRGALMLAPVTVVEIALDGVQRSPRYPGGIALRFARVKRYRPDKAAAEADTIAALRALLRG